MEAWEHPRVYLIRLRRALSGIHLGGIFKIEVMECYRNVVDCRTWDFLNRSGESHGCFVVAARGWSQYVSLGILRFIEGDQPFL